MANVFNIVSIFQILRRDSTDFDPCLSHFHPPLMILEIENPG